MDESSFVKVGSSKVGSARFTIVSPVKISGNVPLRAVYSFSPSDKRFRHELTTVGVRDRMSTHAFPAQEARIDADAYAAPSASS